MHPSLANIGAYIKTNTLALAPAARAAGTVQGPAIDTGAFRSAVLAVAVGAAGGAPTGFTATFTFESRGSTAGDEGAPGPWATVVDRDGQTLSVVATSVDGAVELDLDLSFMGDDHDQLRVKQVLSFTGGSSPTLLTGAVLVQGGSNRLPV
ncbi:hypothetical protein COCOR_04022 [Corallococcus coralloides DSM 2259]|uniref:Uncharacterized protein n=1 Tax=Corallococcus coralloides (strain ATCC 25202 / DSM 2259 / NBRC 100086 / M2) TaxID=1144275 RepID=H8MVP2_CORCM|nr:hypothetical protein [Corallococcus coralloides]AFE05573.1 hypothetical protein COCOR_04022 [Corallococcus coralloides DSM 2259]